MLVRLPLGAAEQVLGHPACRFFGASIPLEEVWSGPASRQLRDRLVAMTSLNEVAAALEHVVAERCVQAIEHRSSYVQIALTAASRLNRASVSAVAEELGLSERHLRRVFRTSLGLSPKKFAQLARFRRAVERARQQTSTNWASIAAATGYYDQAHLIADFRAIAGVTPLALLSELRTAHSLG